MDPECYLFVEKGDELIGKATDNEEYYCVQDQKTVSE